MRGLKIFIDDIIKCKCREDELERINEELVNIRSKFMGVKPLSAYNKKKYVCKLIFMFLMGYQCDIGYLESVNLLSSNAHGEKKIGYLFISVVMNDNNTLMPSIMNAVKHDLGSKNKLIQNLALQFISNRDNTHISESLSSQVFNILLSSEYCDFVRQTAALTLLKILRDNPNVMSLQHSSDKIAHLISHRDLGLATAACSLVEFLANLFPSEYENCIIHAVLRLNKIIISPVEKFKDYVFYKTHASWTVVKLLRILQKFSFPTVPSINLELRECLEFVLEKTITSFKAKGKDYNYTKYSVIFEAVFTIIQVQMDSSLFLKAIYILGNTLKHADPNLRFITVDLLTRLSKREDSKLNIMMYCEYVLDCLKYESDLTLRMCSIELLCNICDNSNVKQIVDEMLIFIGSQGQSVQEEVISKAVFLIEKFSSDLEWYVTTAFNILKMCPDHVNDTKICYLLINFVVNNNAVRDFAARSAYDALYQKPCRESVVKAAAYILGEYGNLIAIDPQCSQLKQLNILREMQYSSSCSTRALLLTTFLKFLNLYPELKASVQSILRQNINLQSADDEVQQRSAEYLRLSEVASKSLLKVVLEEMPSPKRQQFANCIVISPHCSLPSRSEIHRGALWNNPVSLNTKFKEYSINPSDSCMLTDNAFTTMDQLMDTPCKFPVESYSSMLYQETSTLSGDIIPQIVPCLMNEKIICNFLFNEAGTLYGDDYINISLEGEFHKYCGKILFLYRNKSKQSLSNFSIRRISDNTKDKCSMWITPLPDVITGEQSIKQYFHLECLREFTGRPSLCLKFTHISAFREIKLILPITLNKFVEPCDMSLTEFHIKWNNFGICGHEVDQYFEANYPMIFSSTRWRLTGFRLAVIETDYKGFKNFFCSGMFFTSRYRIGFLVRLERYQEMNKYRSTVRSSERSISEKVSDLLEELL